LQAIVLLAVVALSAFFLRRTTRTPLGDEPVIPYPDSEMPKSAQLEFLEGDFTIIKNVKVLPRPVLQSFTEQGGLRLTIANPGKEFLATDVIYDSSLPQKRLIFAGVLNDKCFVYYEQGGIGLSDVLAFFKVQSTKMQPLWRGFCGPAATVQDLRSQIANGKCYSVPKRMK